MSKDAINHLSLKMDQNFFRVSIDMFSWTEMMSNYDADGLPRRMNGAILG